MKKIVLLLISLPLIMASSCDKNDDDQIYCTLEAKAGLNISVSLGAMSSITADGVTVIATDGNYTEALIVIDNTNPVFIGAWERTGTYILTVTKVGYQTYTSEPIRVNADVCHVIPQLRHVVLIPNN